MIQKIYIYRN